MLSREVEAAVQRVAENKYWKEPQAAFILAALSDSGMSVTAFGARFGINPQKLFRWRSRLKGALVAAERPAFHPVEVVAESSAGPLGDGELDVLLRGDRTVRVRRGFDEETLARLVAVLESC